MDAFDAIRWLYLVLAFIFVGWTFKNMIEDYVDMLDNPPYQKAIDTQKEIIKQHSEIREQYVREKTHEIQTQKCRNASKT